jgi:hypothetical protein
MSTALTLSPAQQKVLALISAGFTATAAGRQVGVHRNTVANWLDSDEFCAALETARRHKILLYRDEAEALAAKALASLYQVMDNDKESGAVRLKAIGMALEHARSLMPMDAIGLVPPDPDAPVPPPENDSPMHNDAQLPEPNSPHSPAVSPMPPAPTAINHAKIGRNDLCPCGSGIKFKRCCLGKPVQPAKNDRAA